MTLKKKRKREGELRLTDKKHPVLGIAATITGVISVGVFMAACIISGRQGGNADVMVGFIGMLCLVISILGLIMAWISLHQEDIRPLFPTIGSLSNGGLVIFYMILYVLGI